MTTTTTAITEIRDRKNILPTKIAIEFCFTEEKYNIRDWLYTDFPLAGPIFTSSAGFIPVWPGLVLSPDQLLDVTVTTDWWLEVDTCLFSTITTEL